MQVQTQISNINDLLDSSNLFYQDLLGYKPEQTSLQQIPENKWTEFATERGLNQNSSGIYLPRNQTAVIQGENPLSLFHEYFGHGLYCEQSLLGRKLVDLEKRLLVEEKTEFQGRKFTLGAVQRFRGQNQTFQELENFKQENLGRYEIFAIWTEYLLSGEHNLRDDFGRKYDSLQKEEKEAVDSVIDFSRQYGNLASLYAQGMARKTTPKIVNKLLEDICKEKKESILFGILFGSRKPFSDIDIYLISDEIEPFSSDWIDVRVHTKKRFEEGIKNFDLRTIDPLFSGEFVFGDVNYFEQQKQKVINQPITESAIQFNLRKSEEYTTFKKEDFELCDLVGNSKKYVETYFANASALKEGTKLLTRNDLILYLKQKSLEDNKNLKLHGGAEK